MPVGSPEKKTLAQGYPHKTHPSHFPFDGPKEVPFGRSASGFGALVLWGFGALGLWGFGALGLWGFGRRPSLATRVANDA